jgi:hypothetical protein
MGGAALERFEAQFTATRWAERLRALYDDVLRERAARGGRSAAYGGDLQ